uniref:Uncharacterized protein n=1 Tax=Callorhinchus milii TaxID=7868 RepID=A0A4W3JMQ5_CALMI
PFGHLISSFQNTSSSAFVNQSIKASAPCLIVSSETKSLVFFTRVMAFPRTFLSESFALFVSCLASFPRLSLCSLVTLLPSTSGFRFIPHSLMALVAASVAYEPDQKVKGEICAILILRFFPISSFSSLRLMMSSTKAALMLTRACGCPFPLAVINQWKHTTLFLS